MQNCWFKIDIVKVVNPDETKMDLIQYCATIVHSVKWKFYFQEILFFAMILLENVKIFHVKGAAEHF